VFVKLNLIGKFNLSDKTLGPGKPEDWLRWMSNLQEYINTTTHLIIYTNLETSLAA